MVLDFLPQGYPGRRHAEPVVHAIGKTHMGLLELISKENQTVKPEDEIYIGDGPREKIKFIRGSLNFDKLTNYAKSILPSIVEKLVIQNEQKFITFFNKSGVITPRMHQIELLPGVGKKHLMDLLEERRKKSFESFADMSQRVKLFPDPMKIIVKRILEELEGKEKYYIFTPPPRRFEEGRY